MGEYGGKDGKQKKPMQGMLLIGCQLWAFGAHYPWGSWVRV